MNPIYPDTVIRQKFDVAVGFPAHKRQQLQSHISLIRRIFLQWIQGLIKQYQWLDFTSAIKVNQGIFEAGSCRSQCMLKKSDVDLVFAVPSCITFQMFSSNFIAFLQQKVYWIQGLRLHNIEIRSGLYLPSLVRFFCSPFLFDCLFANVAVPILKDLDSKSGGFFTSKLPLNGLDSPSTIALNSIRSLDIILNQIPPHRKKLWNIFVRYILLWARQKNISSNATGFLSSVSLNIMTVKLMQLFPKVNSLTHLLYHFFTTFGNWDWDRSVVDLLKIKDRKELYQIEPEYQYKKQAIIVLLPTVHKTNACRNMIQPTLAIVVQEMKEAAAILNQILHQDFFRDFKISRLFSRLFTRRGFFVYYLDYFRINCSFSIPITDRNLNVQRKRAGPWIPRQNPLISHVLSEIRHAMKTILANLDTQYPDLLAQGEIYESPILDEKKQQAYLYLGYMINTSSPHAINAQQIMEKEAKDFKRKLATISSASALEDCDFAIELCSIGSDAKLQECNKVECQFYNRKKQYLPLWKS